MSEFKAITTQEEFDIAISEKLKREREVLTKKYSDYDTLKNQVADYEKQIGELNQAMSSSEDKYANYDKILSDLQTQIKSYETNSVKMRIALEAGIPQELAGKLSGETEEDIRKDAELLSGFVGKPRFVAPLKSTEPESIDPRTQALRALTETLTNKGE